MTPIRTLTSSILVAASLMLGACTTPANPNTTLVAFSGKLSASEEVPPGTSTGTGTLKATFDTVQSSNLDCDLQRIDRPGGSRSFPWPGSARTKRRRCLGIHWQFG